MVDLYLTTQALINYNSSLMQWYPCLCSHQRRRLRLYLRLHLFIKPNTTNTTKENKWPTTPPPCN